MRRFLLDWALYTIIGSITLAMVVVFFLFLTYLVFQVSGWFVVVFIAAVNGLWFAWDEHDKRKSTEQKCD